MAYFVLGLLAGMVLMSVASVLDERDRLRRSLAKRSTPPQDSP